MDLLDAHLDLLDTDNSNKHLFVSKTFCRHLQNMSSRYLQDMSSRRLEDVFNVTIFRLPRRFQDIFKTSCELSSRRL